MTVDLLKKTVKPKLNIKRGQVEMNHGAGGKAMQQLIERLFFEAFDNPILRMGNDQARLTIPQKSLVMTTDSYVISPLFFPGGDIGALSVHGTINDLSMGGAVPLYLTSSFILEEGFPLSDLQKIVLSMAKAAKQAGVEIVTGDTKVVEKGKGDGVFINTTGIGYIPETVKMTQSIKTGDKILISGDIGDHGIAIMSQRENLQFDANLLSDSAALNTLVDAMFNVVPNIHCMRDPTRGGVAATLNEWAQQYQVGMLIYEEKLPIKQSVLGACELLGLDPLYIANEGKLMAICAETEAEKLLRCMQQHPLGKNAAIIGEVTNDSDYFVEMQTCFGGSRIVDWLSGEQLPRIC